MDLKGRMVIYAQDIMIFTGRSRSFAYNALNEVRRQIGKSKSKLLTFQEFADYHGIPVDELIESVQKGTQKKGPGSSRS
ncbi:hypothetical protein CLV31_12036 [Algoriphagus aquaeductus]|uniref:Uncharacterized protein n=1 Tax=Algoriphagus aquaeductus TaxID=475299 RepID=A0A326RVL9_9BACT|nr:hypothetical protein [Algoriphagus aquaeductus]PZV77568.1 hypothetical protein CLV31_12036 [Algoriphagus aquaeductus]